MAEPLEPGQPRRNRNVSGSDGVAGGDAGFAGDASHPGEPAFASEVREEWLADLAWFCNRTDGWIRIAPAPEDGAAYFKWKWTAGRWADHYVMVRVGPAELRRALCLLRVKAQLVDDGRRRATPDTYGGGHYGGEQ